MDWLPIDEHSLFFNIVDDNESPRPATVATTLFQGGKFDTSLRPVADYPRMVPDESFEAIAGVLLASSRINARILNVLAFDNIFVNHQPVESDSSFGMYLREETERERVQFGRIKLHYPLSFAYEDEFVRIDNRRVLLAVSRTLHDFAFRVNAFECDPQRKTLDFDASILGSKDIPQSKAFWETSDNGGGASLFVAEASDVYDSEIIHLRQAFGAENVTPDTFSSLLCKWRNRAMQACRQKLSDLGARSIRNCSRANPFSLFDYEFVENGIKKYAIVVFTGGLRKQFVLPTTKTRFLRAFREQASVMLVTNVGETPEVTVFDAERLDSTNRSVMALEYRED